MKLVPGYTFKVTKPKREFKAGETYRIYHISPLTEGVSYIFQCSAGNVKDTFDSTAQAEKIITKMGGK